MPHLMDDAIDKAHSIRCRYCSPLEELKELLRRTSQVERSLCQIEASNDDDEAPTKVSRQQDTGGAEIPEDCNGPDSERQGVAEQVNGAVHGDSREEGHAWEQKSDGLHRHDHSQQKVPTGTHRAHCPAWNAARYLLCCSNCQAN